MSDYPWQIIDPSAASAAEAREELARRYPDVIRVAAGLAAGAWQVWDTTDSTEAARHMASIALAIVTACEDACGVGAES